MASLPTLQIRTVRLFGVDNIATQHMPDNSMPSDER
jgi:hypothetical protein